MKRIAIACVLACAFQHAASAQPNADRAVALYEEGKRHFDIANYRAAIVSWKESYLLSSEPLLLFNIAQAYRLGGDCAQANRFYANYKRAVPKPANQVELEKAMEKCAGIEPATGDVDDKSEPPPKPLPTPAPNTALPSVPPSVANTSPIDRYADRGRTFRIVGLSVAGTGVAAGAVAVLFALRARDKADELGGQPAGTTWSDTHVEAERTGRTAQTRARVFGVIGIAAAITGGGLWWYGRTRSHVRLDVASSGAATEVTLSCAF